MRDATPPKKSECPTDEELTELFDGLLSSDDARALEAHVEGCAACGALASAVRASTSVRQVPRASEAHLEAGARVGRYEIRAWLGAGAMGTVYEALDPSLDRKVALKLIRSEVAGPELEARLLREAKAMARLWHPEIVAVFDAGTDGERLFIAMELVEGGTLRTWMRDAPRSWREVLVVFSRAGRGLAHAHAAGVVHRDFKPDNVLVGKDGRVRVTDFGLARADAVAGFEPSPREAGARDESAIDVSLTRTGAVIGTPAYMPPEQLTGCAADARSDVYSFSVALYEALYGERPFAGATHAELLAAKASNAVRDAPAGSPVPAKLRRALLAGMRARPEERYRSIDALLAALDTAARAWGGRQRALVGGAALLSAGAAAAIVGLRRHRMSEASPPTSALVPPPALDASCESHAACSRQHDGEPYACRASDRRCVPIASRDCAPKLDTHDATDEGTVWIGALLPTKGPAAAAYGAMNLAGADFAREEIAQATRSLAGPGASTRVRRVALVACDDSEDARRATAHLVDDVGVPAILGFGTGHEVVDLAGSMLIGHGVLSVASITPSPLITRLPQPRDRPPLVWRTTYSLDGLARATALFVHDRLEPRAGARSTIRVALARDTTASALSFGEALYKDLVFNGKPAVANGDAYREVVVSPGAPKPEEIDRAARDLVLAAPSVVVLMAARTTTVPLVLAVESRWPVTSPARPIYVVGNDSLEPFAGYLGASAERRRRLFAVESVSSGSGNARFVMRYNHAHENKVSLTLNPAATYDAFYMLAYAVFAVGDGEVTGASLATSCARLLPPGPPIEVGPTQTFDAIRALAAGGRIDLQGAASGLDFDPATGEAPSDFAMLCAGVGAGGAASGEDVESGVVYRARARRVEGSFACP